MENSAKKFKVVVLGCRTNQYEAQAFTNQLRNLGFQEANGEEKADLCIVNTCTVTQSADQRSFYQIRKLNRENPEAQIIVTGCLAEREKEHLLQLPGVREVVPNKEKENLLKRVFPDEELPEFAIEDFSSHTRAFVKVQDGCNSFCSYCVIPYVRGRSVSKPIPDILREIHALVKNGYKEVVLTGINIGDFDGGGKKSRLADLVRAVDEVEGLKRIRISSIDPDEVDDDLLSAVLKGKKTCPSMHIVLQAGSNAVLKRMNRKYTRNDFFDAVKKLKSINKNFTLTTDVIVGFPGETEEDFEETLAVAREAKFAKIHVFPYSKRTKTRAARFQDHLPEGVILERKQKLLRLGEELAFDLRKEFIGKKVQILLESEDPNRQDHLIGHTEHFLMASVPAEGLKTNTIIEAVCTSNAEDGLICSI